MKTARCGLNYIITQATVTVGMQVASVAGSTASTVRVDSEIGVAVTCELSEADRQELVGDSEELTSLLGKQCENEHTFT